MILAQHKNRDWSDTGIAGIQTSQTWAGGEGDGGYFARFAAGARFPRHARHGREQILVLNGAVRFNEVVMRAGDVLQVQRSDEHEAVAPEETLLFVAHHGGIDFVE